MSTYEVIEGKYGAANGSGYSTDDALTIGPVLEELANEGRSTASGVVEEARDGDSAIHPYFEWNDVIAGEEWRKTQARHMLRSIKIQVVNTGDPDDVKEVRAFLPVRIPSATETEIEPSGVNEAEIEAEADGETHSAHRGSSERNYLPVKVVQGNADERKELLEEMYRHLMAFRARYHTYRAVFGEVEETFGEVFATMDRVLENKERASTAGGHVAGEAA
jgi:hypothetical protein